MSSINKVILVGNLGADPELRYTPGGKAVAEMRLATSFAENTEWHRVIAWEKNAENAAKFVSKGSKLYVEGRLQTRNYDDKDGVKRYVTEVVAERVVFLDSKNKAEVPEDPF